jgi:predicted Zn finger-like uncharacterized protein
VKFHCDRCKTKYSIGDERVRGKILKVRCKNCGNVITVREGMTAGDDPPAPERRGRPTTAAPATMVPTSGAAGALASAFAAQMTAPPPPVLEAEWYVSIDGEQHGPYSLADAQRWVSEKPASAELYCWSEGFDDWLLVEKVSQFRNLRNKTIAVRPVAQPAVAVAPAPEGEPKPLFAATMAALESGTLMGQGLGLRLIPQPAKSGDAVKATGTGSAAVPTDGAANSRSPRPTNLGIASPKASSVDASDVNGAAESLSGDELDFGEVSRVVKLADIAKAASPQARKTVRAQALSPRATGAAPKLDPGALNGAEPASNADPAVSEAAPGENMVGAPAVARAHRRGLIMLVGVAAMLLIGVAVAVVFIVNRPDDDPSTGGLTQTKTIDTSRPEEIVRLSMMPRDTTGAPTTSRPPAQRIAVPRPSVGPADETPGTGSKLSSDEIQEMASKNASGTQRCYMRAQRGAQGIEIADLKRLTVTISVNKSGAIDDVQLSEHGADSLGACLTGMIKRWKFRESPGGMYRIVLAFAN